MFVVLVSSLTQRLKQASDPKSLAMLDILRALVAFGGSLWASEVPSVVNQLHVDGLGYELDRKLVESAVKELVSTGVVSAAKAKRATETGAEDDLLIKLRDEKVRLELSGDPVLSKYFSYLSSRLERIRTGEQEY